MSCMRVSWVGKYKLTCDRLSLHSFPLPSLIKGHDEETACTSSIYKNGINTSLKKKQTTQPKNTHMHANTQLSYSSTSQLAAWTNVFSRVNSQSSHKSEPTQDRLPSFCAVIQQHRAPAISLSHRGDPGEQKRGGGQLQRNLPPPQIGANLLCQKPSDASAGGFEVKC